MTTQTFGGNPNPPSVTALLAALERAGIDPDRMPFTPETIDLATALLEQEIDWEDTTALEVDSQEVECRLCHRMAPEETCVIGPPDGETGECEATCEECVDGLERAFWGEE